MVYYRKYRPQTIEELDSEALRETLTSVFTKRSTPHAFLFTGPKGLGKTSTARIVAKIINCEQNSKLKTQNSKIKLKSKNLKDQRLEASDQIEPCNKCEQCISITNGSNVDILEIDAASNRGIDEIRDLRDKIRLSPVSAQKKVYIIDEVHMLTTEAFNALLKTLEEPPSHALFILCTTEFHKVPATIISRCFHISMKTATTPELVRSFKRIVTGEGINITDDALLYIASVSDGSFRDGAKTLEEIALLSNGKKITTEWLEEKYKISGIVKHVTELLGFLAEKNTVSALGVVTDIISQGIDIKYFLERLIESLHIFLLIQAGIKNEKVSYTFSKIAEKFGFSELRVLLDSFTKAHTELKYTVITQLPLELAIIEYTQVQNNGEVNVNPPVNQQSRHSGDTAVQGTPESPRKKTTESDSGPFGLAQGRQARMTGIQKPGDLDLLPKLINLVKVSNQSTAGLLRGSQVHVTDDTVVIEALYKFHADKLNEQKTRELLEKAVSELTGKKVKVSVILREQK